MTTKAKKVKPISKLRLDLLNDLADYLHNLDNQFNLSMWVMEKDAGRAYFPPDNVPKLTANPKHKDLIQCGMTACAMGHAPSVPSIAAAGLKLGKRKDSDGDTMFIPVHKGRTGIYAAQDLFGIPQRLAEDFFMPGHYNEEDLKKPKVVAARIRAFVKDPFEYLDARGISV